MTDRPRECKARQHSDQKHCDRCGLVWDMNDPEPPECKTVAEIELEKMRSRLTT